MKKRRKRSREEEYIGKRKCRRKTRVNIMIKEVKVWTYSSKQQEAPLEITKTKEDIRLEQIKRNLKRAALEWDGCVLQEQLKALMYVERLLRFIERSTG